MSIDKDSQPTFGELNLAPAVLQAVQDIGYEAPSPIQAQTIPFLLEGRDVLGQAQTGTGKTGAFALPLLSNIDLGNNSPQLLVLAPTRELAIQVAEAFQTYAKHLKGFHVLPIYGGQSYEIQLRALKRGVHVVVGTPGRVMDHMRRRTLKLHGLRALVLDEADEMLRMGFIDDVKWILEQTPDNRQIALFSATMPPIIRKIAEQHLNDPKQVTVKVKTTTAETIRQRYLVASGRKKMDALTRILEAEPFDGMIIFVRTKTATEDIAAKLEARGFSASALNGDITQKMREATVNRLKKGQIDIIVATDVAARGLDVERISHVINYDIPQDTEPYVHRIGRTGRAGRKGDAILFVAPREKRMLYAIERATKQRIEQFEMPTAEAINSKRINEFNQRISDTLESDADLKLFTDIVEQYCADNEVSTSEVAAALAKMVQGNKSLLLANEPRHSFKERAERNPRFDAPEDKRKSMQNRRVEMADDSSDRKPRREKPAAKALIGPKPDRGMERYRLEVGGKHGVKPDNIVGAIANEMGLESEFIGNIQIMDDHSTVDLPEGMPKELYKQFCQIRVAGRPLDATSLSGPTNSKPPSTNKRRGKPSGTRGGQRSPRRTATAPKGKRKPPRRK